MLQYIEATLMHGYSKKDAYLNFIDGTNKNPVAAANRLEKKQEYRDIYATVSTDENHQFQIRAQKVRGKFLKLVEKNIDTVDGVLEDVQAENLQSKATAVRLVNETVQAMSVVSGGAPEQRSNAPRLDKSGVIS
jgi:hypothetical protein